MVFLFVFIIIICGLIFSKIKTEIINFKFSSINIKHLNKDYKIIIKFCIFNKLPIFKITLTPNKLKKLGINQKVRNMAKKAIKKNKQFDKTAFIALKRINIIIKKIKLKLDIGTENAAFTAIAVGVISTIIALLIGNKVKDYNKQTFTINPVYINQNLINIGISGIFEIKMIHIINIIYILNKKEGVNKYERASNRRSYDYSYE